MFATILNAICNLSNNRVNKSRPQTQGFRPSFESLEDRFMPSASPVPLPPVPVGPAFYFTKETPPKPTATTVQSPSRSLNSVPLPPSKQQLQMEDAPINTMIAKMTPAQQIQYFQSLLRDLPIVLQNPASLI